MQASHIPHITNHIYIIVSIVHIRYPPQNCPKRSTMPEIDDDMMPARAQYCKPRNRMMIITDDVMSYYWVA